MMLNLDFEETIPAVYHRRHRTELMCGWHIVMYTDVYVTVDDDMFANYWNHSNGLHACAINPAERDVSRVNLSKRGPHKKKKKKWTLFHPDEVIEDMCNVQCGPIEAEESIKLVYYGTCRMANHNSSLYFDCICDGSECIQWSGRARQNISSA